MLWAVAKRAVLVTNLNFGDQLGAYQVPALTPDLALALALALTRTRTLALTLALTLTRAGASADAAPGSAGAEIAAVECSVEGGEQTTLEADTVVFAVGAQALASTNPITLT